ncbi:MAG: hypothetical protein J5478_00700 [Bacteroidales bacterium]|nr:hypothetical protein [Bacteroidales bacterium]
MATEKLDIMQTIKDGVQYGLKNFFPLLLMVILYAVTVWIPYLNIGTTIGLYKAVIGIGRGETIDPTSIFSKDNFKNLSGFFLLLGLLYIGIVVACFFMFIPGMVMSIAWGFAVYFFLDKKVSPLKSLQLSYDSTYGNKWRIFLVGIVCGLLIGIICGILAAIPKVGFALSAIAVVLACAIMVAVEGVMYNFFSKKADEILNQKNNDPACPAEPVVEAEVDEVIDTVRTEA